MSTFNAGRRGPNVSQFLRDLHENPAMETSAEGYRLNEQEFTMFTNSDFFDHETGQNTDFQPQPSKMDTESTPDNSAATGSVIDDFSSLDFMSGDFNFSDYNGAYTSPTIPSYGDGLGNLQAIQPNPSVYPPVPQAPQQQNGYGRPPPRISDRRKAEALSPTHGHNLEEATRVAAEEDKRRRNTAASARFRVKKKQREQALEKSAKEMTEKVTSLEGRIQQLETENKWLKNIVLEKNGGNEELLSKLLDDLTSRREADSKRDANRPNTPVPTSPEEREAADSSG